MENIFNDIIPQNVLDEEIALLQFMRSTMSSSAVNKDVPKFHAFCEQLIELPFDERVSFAFDFFDSIEGYPKIEPKSMKSSVEALKFKNSGNAAFKRGNFVEALKFYTQSVAVAPVGSPDLAVAFGNRSAVLFELQRYEGCVVDINRALNEDNCPETTRPKLLNRKEKCSKLIEQHAAKFNDQKSVQKLSPKDKGCPIDEDALDLDYSGKFPLPKPELKNENISNASDKIKLNFNLRFGRHIVAAKDIKIGEFIGIEKAYASVLMQECQYSHCANCFLRCEALIPCSDCSAVMYCSRRCREDDFDRSHRIECQVYSRSYSLDLTLTSSTRLAIQTLMVGTKQGENLEKLMTDPLFKNPMKPVPNDVLSKKLDSQDFHRILTLANNAHLLDYDLSRLTEAALRIYPVLMITYILEGTSFFDSSIVKNAEKPDEDVREKRKYVALLFLKLWISIPRHTNSVDELLQEKVDGEILMHTDGVKSVGKGLYMFTSIFNHSCSMNVTGNFYKDTLVTQAMQPIKAGEQLFVNYGPYFTMMPRLVRQLHLRLSYQFECRCEACEQDWPIFPQMSNDWGSVPNRFMNLRQLMYYEVEMETFVINNPLRLIEYDKSWFNFFCKYLTIFHKHFKKPIQDHVYTSMAFQLLLQSRGSNYVLLELAPCK